MAASMTSKMGKTEDIVTIIQECKRLGIPVLSPDINSSQGIFTANTKHQILFGLAGIRNVGIGVVEDVVAAREKGGPFKSIFDFCKRVAEYQGSLKEKRPPLSKKTLECLIMAGALDGLPGSRAVLMATVDRALEVAARYQEDKSKGQMSLFDMGGADSSISNIAEVLEDAEEWGSVEMLNKEREVLGLCLSGHPLDEFRPELIGFTTCSLSQEELARKEGCVVAVGGIVTRMRSVETKRGATIGFGEMQDFQGEVGLFFKKDTWESFRDKISEDDRILVKGTLEYQRDREKNITEQMQVVVEEAYQLDYVRERMVKYIHANIYSSMLSEEFLQKLEMGMQQFEAFEGEPGSELVLHIETESSYEHGLTLHKYKLSYSQDVLNWLKQDMGASKVWVSGKPRR